MKIFWTKSTILDWNSKRSWY